MAPRRHRSRTLLIAAVGVVALTVLTMLGDAASSSALSVRTLATTSVARHPAVRHAAHRLRWMPRARWALGPAFRDLGGGITLRRGTWPQRSQHSTPSPHPGGPLPSPTSTAPSSTVPTSAAPTSAAPSPAPTPASTPTDSGSSAPDSSGVSSGTPAPTTPSATVTPTPTASTTSAAPSPWKLVYRDSFDAPLDTTNAWGVYTQPGQSNQGTSWWSADHVTVSGGDLHINGYVDTSAAPDGRVVTGGLGLWKRPQMYGKYEMLVRMDRCADVKYAWMLWPYAGDWPSGGEVDFAEDGGGDRSSTAATLHWADANGNNAFVQDGVQADFSQWHRVGVEWTPDHISYTLDGRVWATETQHLPPRPMVLVMQTEGLAWPGHVTIGTGSCNADVQWVEQYAWQG